MISIRTQSLFQIPFALALTGMACLTGCASSYESPGALPSSNTPSAEVAFVIPKPSALGKSPVRVNFFIGTSQCKSKHIVMLGRDPSTPIWKKPEFTEQTVKSIEAGSPIVLQADAYLGPKQSPRGTETQTCSIGLEGTLEPDKSYRLVYSQFGSGCRLKIYGDNVDGESWKQTDARKPAVCEQ